MAKTTRIRRSALEILAVLEDLRDKKQAKLNALDERISRVKNRGRVQIALAEFVDKTTEDIQAELEQTRAQQKLLRKALKIKA